MSYDPKIFFNTVRGGIFGGRMSSPQVDGMNALLAAWDASYKADDVRWLAYALATAQWETDGTMQPIPEQGHGGTRPYNVPDPVTHQTYYGRGYVQLTWRDNYAHMGTKLGVDLLNHPELALDPTVAADILFGGMIGGDFTGRKLADYFNATTADAFNARRIVNGLDRAQIIADRYKIFLSALHVVPDVAAA